MKKYRYYIPQTNQKEREYITTIINYIGGEAVYSPFSISDCDSPLHLPDIYSKIVDTIKTCDCVVGEVSDLEFVAPVNVIVKERYKTVCAFEKSTLKDLYGSIIPQSKRMLNNKIMTTALDKDERWNRVYKKINGQLRIGYEVGNECYAIEEMAELTKELIKERLDKGNEEKIFDECCDVLSTTLMVLIERKLFDFDKILQRMEEKLDRNKKRFENGGEV